jgi:hypothetical protein
MYKPFVKQVTNVGPPLTIIGKDLDVGSTFNADVNPNAGKQRAGRFMSYDPATKQLTPWDGVADAGGLTIFGVLADDLDVLADNQNVSAAAMVYRTGNFLRQEIESANNAHIPPGGPLDVKLDEKGIYLEWSYEGYLGVEPVPSGVEPVNAEPQSKEAPKK